jgi:hypothetical protein
MPLKKGYSAKTIGRNIGYEMKKHSGMKPAQAVAIALSTARTAAQAAHKPGIVARFTQKTGRGR